MWAFDRKSGSIVLFADFNTHFKDLLSAADVFLSRMITTCL